MQKNLRDMVASKNIGLSEDPMVASGGSAVVPLPEPSGEDSDSSRLREMLNSPEDVEPMQDSKMEPKSPLRDYFVEPNGKEKLRNAEMRLKQTLNLGQSEVVTPDNYQMTQEV